jgi:hypothetical protein
MNWRAPDMSIRSITCAGENPDVSDSIRRSSKSFINLDGFSDDRLTNEMIFEKKRALGEGTLTLSKVSRW